MTKPLLYVKSASKSDLNDTSLEPMPSAQFCFASPACSTDSQLARGSTPGPLGVTSEKLTNYQSY